MQITIDNKLRVSGATSAQITALKKALTLPNPVYQTLLRRVKYGRQSHKCLYAVKKEFKYYDYDKDNNVLSCGRGNTERFVKYLGVKKLKTDLTDKPLSNPLNFFGGLREYQLGITDKIISNGQNGIIKLGTGFGKTLIACEIIRKLNKTALIIVPRVSLLTQFKETLESFHGYSPGIIQGKNWNVKDITVASMATLKGRTLTEIAGKFSIVICDEAHTTISEKGIRVVQCFNPSYLYGASATPRRTDEQGEAIFFTFGKILVNKALPQTPPKVQVYKSNIDIKVSIDYHEMIDEMVESSDRNNLVVKLALQEIKNGRKILILTKRIAHYLLIKNKIKGLNVYCISSDTPQKERDILLTKLRNNEIDFDVILGTFSLLSTGVDIPRLDTLVIAGDLKSSVLAEQSAGRISRLFSGKQNPKIIDIDDNLNPILHKQALERKRFYKLNKWEIV